MSKIRNFTKKENRALYMLLSCGAACLCEDYPRCSDDPSAEELREFLRTMQSAERKEIAIPYRWKKNFYTMVDKYDDENDYRLELNEKVEKVIKRYDDSLPVKFKQQFEEALKNNKEDNLEDNVVSLEAILNRMGFRDTMLLIWFKTKA